MLRSAFAAVGATIERHPLVVIAVAVVLLLAAFGGAAQITSVTGNEAFTADNPTLERFQDTFDRSTVAVLIRGQVTDPRTMRAIDRFDRRLSARENVVAVVSPADRVRATYGTIPGDEAKIARVVETGDAAFVDIILASGLSQKQERPVYTDAVRASEWAQFPAGVDVTITGQAAFSAQLSTAIQSSTQQQLGLAVGLMVVALFFLFRGVRLRLLPVVAVFVGVIYTFGAIGYAGIPNSTLTSAVFPILIGLGIDYSVQFHQRYEEELARAPPREALPRALSSIGPAVLVAMVAAALGFGATWISTRNSPAFVWFAQTSIFGVLLTFLAALLVLVPVLTLWARLRGEYGGQEQPRAATAADGGTPADEPPTAGQSGEGDTPERPAPADGASAADDEADPGRFGRALGTGSRALAAHPVFVLVVAALLTTGGFYAGTQLETLADTEEFIPQDLPALLDLEQFRAETGGGSAVQFDVLVAGEVTHPETLRWMARFDRVATGTPSVVGVQTPADVVRRYNDGRLPRTEAGVERALARAPPMERQRFVTEGYGRIVVVSRSGLSTDETLSFISNVRSALQFSRPPSGVDAELTGTSVVSTPSIIDQIESRTTTTALGFGFVLLALLLYYRDPTRAVAPLVPMAFVVGWQNLYMYGLGIRVSPLGASLGALTVGIGAEYTVIVMERYYEEVERAGVSPLDAVETAATRVGKAISVSGMTTVFGFSALAASPFPIIADFGFLTVGVIALTLVAALATLPPTLVVLHRVERALGRGA
ncbi:MAG: RND family transporter [Haloferacaceae archaeon]